MKYGHFKSRLDEFLAGWWHMLKKRVVYIPIENPKHFKRFDVKVREISPRERRKQIKKNREILNGLLYGDKRSI